MYVCLCNGVTEHDIRNCLDEGACTLRDLQCYLGVGASCGRCALAAKAVLNEHRERGAKPLAAPGVSA